MKNKIISKGAEAIIFIKEKNIIKERIPKSYRNSDLDEKIRKSRTKREAKILEKAKKIMNVPEIKEQEKFSLTLEYIPGDKLSESLNSYSQKRQEETMKKLGKQVAKMHEEDIVHGDLTTSNVILKDEKIYIIDFGLGFISKRIEDRAVDLHLIKQALEAKHWQNYENLFKNFLEGYEILKDSKKVLEQLRKVESRGRYKH